ncbi:carbohydrate kinase [Colwelliaceae bacterium 6441]
MSLLAFGEALVDFLSDGQEPESFTKFPGGAPANVAVAYAKLGGKSMFCGAIGQDMFGDFLIRSLQNENVNTQYCVRTKQAKTGLAFVSLDNQGERSFSFYRPPAADLLFNQNDFDNNAFECADIFHICSNSLTEFDIYQSTMTGLDKARQAKCICSFDINLRSNLWLDIEQANDRIWQCISQCDVLKLSPEELQFLIDEDPRITSIDDLVVQAFLAGVSLVVYTRGELAVKFYSAHHVGEAAIPNITVVDTTAAGDAFVGGLLLSLSEKMKQGSSFASIVGDLSALKTTVEFATLCGAYACQREGAFPSLPTLEAINSMTASKDK